MFGRRSVLILSLLLFAVFSTRSLCDEYPELTIPLPEGSEQTITWLGDNPDGVNVYVEGWPTIANLSAFRQHQIRHLTFHVLHYQLVVENDAVAFLQGNPFGFCDSDTGCVSELNSDCVIVFWEKGGYGPSACNNSTVKTFHAGGGIYCSCDCYGAGYNVIRCSTYVPPPAY